MREYKGVTVPWVAAWSGEVPNPDDHPLYLDQTGTVHYQTERPGDRDPQGVLWLRNRLAPGEGTPMFAQVHANRQRSCMVTPRCQVCGLGMVQHAFLLQEKMLDRYDKQGYITTATPPVCNRCIPIAVKLCPQLEREPLIRVVATNVGMWGYLGDVADADGGGTWTRSQNVAVNDPRLRRLLAKQVVVALTQWTEEPWPASSRTTASTPS